MNSFTPAEMATLRRAAANKSGTAFAGWSTGKKLRHCFKHYIVLRNKDGKVVGFGREGYVLTPNGEGLYDWCQQHQRLAHINA